MVLGIFPKTFSKCDFPTDNVPNGNFPNVSFPNVWPSAAARMAKEAERCGLNRVGQTWEVATWEFVHSGGCQVKKYPWEVDAWENDFGKVSPLQ